MKRLFFALLLNIHVSYAFAGDEFNQLMADISTYQSEQRKAPDHIIKYSDDNGNVARSVLNPDRAKRFIDEIMNEPHYAEKLKEVLYQYKPITQNYVKAFDRSPGQYDAEYLDHFEFYFQLLVANGASMRNLHLETIQNEGQRALLEAFSKLVLAMPSILLDMLEKQINDNKFSEPFKPQAVAKLNHFREIQSLALKTEASSK